MEEENEDRLIIMQRVIDLNENLRDDDIEFVKKIMAKKNQENANKGELIQLEDGQWINKN